jgi:hypothetical protein
MTKSTLAAVGAAAFVLLLFPAGHLAAQAGAAKENPQNAAPVAPAASAETAPGIEGNWVLNTELSDSRERLRDQGPGGEGGYPRGGGGGGGGWGGMGGRGGRGGMGGGRGGFGGYGGRGGTDPEAREKMQRAMRELMDAPEHLSITRHAQNVVVADPEGLTVTLQPNGKKIKETRPDGTEIKRKTKWDGPNLVTEVTGKDLPKMITTYGRSFDGKHLSVSTKVDGGWGTRAMTITKVYDPAPAAAKQG